MGLAQNCFKDKFDKEKALVNFGLLFQYAMDDVRKGFMSADEFYRAIEMSGKYYKFSPSYPELVCIRDKLRDEDKDMLAVIPREFHLNEAPATESAQAKENIKKIKSMINRTKIKTKGEKNDKDLLRKE